MKDNFHTLLNETRQHISRLDYTVKDELNTKFLGGIGSSFLQQVNYEYLSNGFLKGINPSRTSGGIRAESYG